MKRLLVLLTVGFAGGVAAHADLMPDFATVPAGWATDRYDPHSFTNVGSFAGRSDVLGIEINVAEGAASRPAAQSGTFYDTQGKQHAIAGGAGSSISAFLYLPSSWSTPASGNERTDMWGVISDPSAGSDPHQYPIIGFTNFGGAPRFRVWDEDTVNGWVDLPTPVAFDTWTALSIEYTGTRYDFLINGVDVYSDTTVHGATGFSAVIMQAFNFNDAAIPGAVGGDYTAHWSNASAVPEPSSWFLLGTVLLGVGFTLRKRLA